MTCRVDTQMPLATRAVTLPHNIFHTLVLFIKRTNHNEIWLLCIFLEASSWICIEHICLETYVIFLTHCGRVTYICVVKLTSIGSDNGLALTRRQAIIWTNDGILLIGPLWTNFIEIFIGIQTFSFKKMHLKMSSAKWRPFRLGLNVLRRSPKFSIL